MISERALKAITNIREAQKKFEECIRINVEILEAELSREVTGRIKAEERNIRVAKALDSSRMPAMRKKDA